MTDDTSISSLVPREKFDMSPKSTIERDLHFVPERLFLARVLTAWS